MITIIPAIDIMDGKCVRLTHGDYGKKTVYYSDPLDAAKKFEDMGIKRLHLVDLDGAKARQIMNLHVLSRLSSKTGLEIDFGGGIKTTRELESVFNEGASMASVGSVAVQNEALFVSWIEKYGPEKIFLGADVRDGKISVGGWLENTSIDVFSFIEKMCGFGVRYFFCTDISRDGALGGPGIELYREILKRFPGLSLTASGGVRDQSDVDALEKIGCTGVIIGKAFYEGKM